MDMKTFIFLTLFFVATMHADPLLVVVLMVKNEGKVLTHQYLLRAIWGPGYINQSQYLRVFIAQIRKKIEEDPNRPKHLLTESGVGYRFM